MKECVETILINPFNQIDHLIDRRIRIPAVYENPAILQRAFCEVPVYKNNIIELSDVLLKIKEEYVRMQKERDEIKKDLRTVLTNGSVSWKWNEYYNNGKEVEEAQEIFKKYFKNREIK